MGEFTVRLSPARTGHGCKKGSCLHAGAHCSAVRSMSCFQQLPRADADRAVGPAPPPPRHSARQPRLVPPLLQGAAEEPLPASPLGCQMPPSQVRAPMLRALAVGGLPVLMKGAHHRHLPSSPNFDSVSVDFIDAARSYLFMSTSPSPPELVLAMQPLPAEVVVTNRPHVSQGSANPLCA
jgi:hypothetical protein